MRRWQNTYQTVHRMGGWQICCTTQQCRPLPRWPILPAVSHWRVQSGTTSQRVTGKTMYLCLRRSSCPQTWADPEILSNILKQAAKTLGDSEILSKYTELSCQQDLKKSWNITEMDGTKKHEVIEQMKDWIFLVGCDVNDVLQRTSTYWWWHGIQLLIRLRRSWKKY